MEQEDRDLAPLNCSFVEKLIHYESLIEMIEVYYDSKAVLISKLCNYHLLFEGLTSENTFQLIAEVLLY